MKPKLFALCILISAFLWILPFTARIFIVRLPKPPTSSLTLDKSKKKSNEYNAIEALHKGDKYNAFVSIFKNNITGCIINIAGGAILGITTIFNLIYNGFFSANVLVNIHESGTSISHILRQTMPHSFEVIGFWISGGIGIYLAYNIIQYIRNKEAFTKTVFIEFGFGCLITIIIIISSAYVEAYISSMK